MGGYGSNRWGGYQRRYTVEEALTLDIRKLARDGVVGRDHTHTGRLDWRSAGGSGPLATIGYCWQPDAADGTGTLTLSFALASGPIEQAIHIGRTASNVGGWHWHCCCPSCGKRARKLHKPPDRPHFTCRTCANLTYRCNQESRQFRGLFRRLATELGTTADEIRRALG